MSWPKEEKRRSATWQRKNTSDTSLLHTRIKTCIQTTTLVNVPFLTYLHESSSYLLYFWCLVFISRIQSKSYSSLSGWDPTLPFKMYLWAAASLISHENPFFSSAHLAFYSYLLCEVPPTCCRWGRVWWQTVLWSGGTSWSNRRNASWRSTAPGSDPSACHTPALAAAAETHWHTHTYTHTHTQLMNIKTHLTNLSEHCNTDLHAEMYMPHMHTRQPAIEYLKWTIKCVGSQI